MEIPKYAALTICLVAAGCSSSDGKDDLTTSEVANTSATLAGALVREVGDATGILTSLTALQVGLDATVGGTAGADGADGVDAPLPPPPPAGALVAAASRLAAQPALQRPMESAAGWLATAVVDPASGTDQAAADLEAFLRTRVFTEANRESGDADSATFLLHGATLCTDGVVVADPACVSTVDELELRVVATRIGGGFDFAILIGPARANPVTLGLRPASLAVSIDLAGVKAATAHVADVSGSPIPLPAIMEGAFRLALNDLGEQHVSIVASVLSAIHVREEAVDGPYEFTTQPADPLVSFEADAVAGEVTVQVGFGATTVLMPYLVNVATASPSGFTTFGIDLGGLSWTLRATVAAPDVVELTGLGLGATQTRVWAAKADDTGVDAVTLDLTGAPIDVTVQDDPAEGTTVTATPFGLALHLGLGQLDLDTPPDVGTVDDTWELSLDAGSGGADPVLFIPLACDPLVATCPTVQPALQVVTGALTMTQTDPADAVTSVVVAEGQCLLDDGTGTLSAGSCTPPVP